MSKVNILKIIEGVGACSENLIGISENLISISEKVSVISKVIVRLYLNSRRKLINLQSKLRLRNQHQSRLKPRLSR